ncbi:helix-turn-helix transcriptional regulator [Paenibacillus sp. FSL R5-0407]|uniref:helix-turn-helix transcriptional regulator n=1 Tax=Paenibacillus sp. FSL R5-0407 TaxID=2975320 RepID=UPI0030F91DB1
MGVKIEENMLRLLEERDWTVYRLSKESDVAVSALYNIASGKKKAPNVETAVKIANAFGVSLDELVLGKKEGCDCHDGYNNLH